GSDPWPRRAAWPRAAGRPRSRRRDRNRCPRPLRWDRPARRRDAAPRRPRRWSTARPSRGQPDALPAAVFFAVLLAAFLPAAFFATFFAAFFAVFFAAFFVVFFAAFFAVFFAAFFAGAFFATDFFAAFLPNRPRIGLPVSSSSFVTSSRVSDFGSRSLGMRPLSLPSLMYGPYRPLSTWMSLPSNSLMMRLRANSSVSSIRNTARARSTVYGSSSFLSEA